MYGLAVMQTISNSTIIKNIDKMLESKARVQVDNYEIVVNFFHITFFISLDMIFNNCP